MTWISAVSTTKKEENNIRKYLESVIWADVISVIADVSTDKTVEIYGDYTLKIYISDSQNSFHINKNRGIERPNEDWILSKDADETVTPA